MSAPTAPMRPRHGPSTRRRRTKGRRAAIASPAASREASGPPSSRSPLAAALHSAVPDRPDGVGERHEPALVAPGRRGLERGGLLEPMLDFPADLFRAVHDPHAVRELGRLSERGPRSSRERRGGDVTWRRLLANDFVGCARQSEGHLRYVAASRDRDERAHSARAVQNATSSEAIRIMPCPPRFLTASTAQKTTTQRPTPPNRNEHGANDQDEGWRPC